MIERTGTGIDDCPFGIGTGSGNIGGGTSNAGVDDGWNGLITNGFGNGIGVDEG